MKIPVEQTKNLKASRNEHITAFFVQTSKTEWVDNIHCQPFCFYPWMNSTSGHHWVFWGLAPYWAPGDPPSSDVLGKSGAWSGGPRAKVGEWGHVNGGTRWWFQKFFLMFLLTPVWLIFFKWVETLWKPPTRGKLWDFLWWKVGIHREMDGNKVHAWCWWPLSHFILGVVFLNLTKGWDFWNGHTHTYNIYIYIYNCIYIYAYVLCD